MSRAGTPQQGTFGNTQTGSGQTGTFQSGTQTTQTGNTQAFRERVAKKAYEKWMNRGCKHGNDFQDWCEAEAEVLAEQKQNGGTTNYYR